MRERYLETDIMYARFSGVVNPNKADGQNMFFPCSHPFLSTCIVYP